MGLFGCTSENDEAAEQKEKLVFATSADYPPFEYINNGEIVGFDVDIIKAIGEKLDLEIELQDISFSSIFPSISNGLVDGGISAITKTEEREKNFDFSIPYYEATISLLALKSNPLKSKEDLEGKKIAVQLGSTMELWAKSNIKSLNLTTFDFSTQSIEALRAQHVDAVILDTSQAESYAQKNTNMEQFVLDVADSGYVITFKKGSDRLSAFNAAIMELRESGTISELAQKHELSYTETADIVEIE